MKLPNMDTLNNGVDLSIKRSNEKNEAKKQKALVCEKNCEKLRLGTLKTNIKRLQNIQENKQLRIKKAER